MEYGDILTRKCEPWTGVYKEIFEKNGLTMPLSLEDSIKLLVNAFPTWGEGELGLDIENIIIGGVLKKRCEYCRHYSLEDNKEFCHRHLDESNHPTFCEGCVEHCCDFELDDSYRERAIKEWSKLELIVSTIIENYLDSRKAYKEEHKESK